MSEITSPAISLVNHDSAVTKNENIMFKKIWDSKVFWSFIAFLNLFIILAGSINYGQPLIDFMFIITGGYRN